MCHRLEEKQLYSKFQWTFSLLPSAAYRMKSKISNNTFSSLELSEDDVEKTLKLLQGLQDDNDTQPSYIYEHDRTRPVIVSAISSIGITFNIIVIMLIVVLKDYKKTSHWYVLNLAIADFIFLLMLPFDVAESLMGGWFFGEASYPLCMAYKSAFYINYYAGIFFLSVMSFDRYVAILHPISTEWNVFRSYRGSWIITIATWLLAIAAVMPALLKTVVTDNACLFDFPASSDEAFEIDETKMIEESIKMQDYISNMMTGMRDFPDTDLYPDLLGQDYMSGDNSTMDVFEKIDEGFNNWAISGQGFNGILSGIDHSTYYCKHAYYRYFVIWMYCNFILTFVIPLLVLTICYGCILWRVLHPRSSAPRTQRESNGSTSTTKKRRRSSSLSGANNTRITLLVVSLVVVFVICWMPFHVMNLVKIGGIALNKKDCNTLENAVQLVAFSNSLLNPIFYTFLGASFHRRVHDVWLSFHRRYSRTSETRGSSRAPKWNEPNHVYRYSSTKNTKAFSTSDDKPMMNFEMASVGNNKNGDLNSNNVDGREVNEHQDCTQKLVDNNP